MCRYYIFITQSTHKQFFLKIRTSEFLENTDNEINPLQTPQNTARERLNIVFAYYINIDANSKL